MRGSPKYLIVAFLEEDDQTGRMYTNSLMLGSYGIVKYL